MQFGKNQEMVLRYFHNLGGSAIEYRGLKSLFSDNTSGRVLCSQTVNGLIQKRLIDFHYIVDCEGPKLRYDVENTRTGAVVHLWSQKTRPTLYKRYYLTIKGHELLTAETEDLGKSSE